MKSDEIENEIEKSEGKLKEDIGKKEKEAGERLDGIFSKGKMEFCSFCNRKIDSRMVWGGKCFEDGCDKLLCNTCWSVGEKRCREHKERITQEISKPAISEDAVKTLTMNYMGFLQERLAKSTVDWTPREYIKKAGARVKGKDYPEFAMEVFSRGFFRKKGKIVFHVRPFILKGVDMESDIYRFLDKMDYSRFNVLVLVGEEKGITIHSKMFAEGFSNQALSLFIIEPEEKKIFVNKNDPKSMLYLPWVSPAGKPTSLKEAIEGMAETVSGRKVVKTQDFEKLLGLPEGGGFRYLKKTPFLEKVDQGSFMLREEKQK